MDNTNAFAADIKQMMNDWNSATPEQREAASQVARLRAEWVELIALGKTAKARRVAEDLEFWTNKSAFLAAR